MFTLTAEAQNQLTAFEARLKLADRMIGYPLAKDLDYSPLNKYAGTMLNNVGDPFLGAPFELHSRELEVPVLEHFAELFRAPADNYWGYVTGGSSESILYGLYTARQNYPDAVVYHSADAHFGVAKNIRILDMTAEPVKSQESGEIDYQDLHHKLVLNRHKPAVIVANIGTTMTEAIDDLAQIKQALKAAGILEYYIHCDAAMAGAYASLIEPRPAYDFADGADSISVSGHKFLGTPMPSGVVLVRQDRRHKANQIAYISSPDVTIGCSRSGHTTLALWYGLQLTANGVMKQRYEDSLELAKHTEAKLQELGWPAWRNPHAITVVLATPSKAICRKWQLASEHEWSHVICMPGVTRQHIDDFLADLAADITTTSSHGRKRAEPETELEPTAA